MIRLRPVPPCQAERCPRPGRRCLERLYRHEREMRLETVERAARAYEQVTVGSVSRWCAAALGSPVATVDFRAGHLSQVLGVTLADGRPVVVKVRGWQDRLLACTGVQRHLAATGFPCPVPLAGPERQRGFALSAETLLTGGHRLDPAGNGAAFAHLLHRLIAAAPPVDRLPSLRPALPWTAWDHDQRCIWPAMDDAGAKLTGAVGPAWLDRSAQHVRRALHAYAAAPVVGHGDFESQNIRWSGRTPLVVHDWDSVIAQPEAVVVGLAAAVWPAQGRPGQSASVSQTEDFLTAYEQARGRGWTNADRQAAWTAGLWVRLFNAKKDAAGGGGPQLDRLDTEIDERLSRAALPAR